MTKINESKTKLVLILAVAALSIILTVALLINSRADGHYVAKEYESIGVTFYIDLDGSSYEMVATSRNLDGSSGENKTTGSFEIKEDIITIEFEGSELVGAYNKKEGTIILNGITFSKE